MQFNVTSVHTSTTQEEDLGHVVYKGESTQEKNPSNNSLLFEKQDWDWKFLIDVCMYLY